MNIVIGLIGVKTSGKSTVASIIKKHIKSAKEAALADKIKNVCSEVFSLPREYFDRQDLKEVQLLENRELTIDKIEKVLKEYNIPLTTQLRKKYIESDFIGKELTTPREIAQYVGTEVLRNMIDEYIHCDNVPVGESKFTIISDVRFKNEFDYFKARTDIYFIPLYINRISAEKLVNRKSHKSEKGIFKFKELAIKIDNNGSIEETERNVLKELSDYGLLDLQLSE